MTPNFEHPVYQVAVSRLVEGGEDGTPTISDDSLRLIAFGLRKHGNDPELPAAIVALYDLARGLIEEMKAPETAIRILTCIAGVAPELECLKDAEGAVARIGAETVKAAPRIDDAAPEGALKLSSFQNPGMQTPFSLRNKKPQPR